MKYGRLVIIFFVTLVLSFLLHLLMQGMNFSYASVSDAVFVTGVVALLPSLVAISQAYQVFHGFNYAVRSFWSTTFRQTYPKFGDYKKEKTNEVKSTFFFEMFIVSATFAVVGIILATVSVS